MKKPKAIVALSGGVDSSVAAILLKEKRFDLIGITLNVYSTSNYRYFPYQQAVNDAGILAKKLGIPHFIIDVRDDFNDIVTADFVSSYLNGITPNPCVLCNYQVKFKKLLDLADEFGCEYIATGHYAIINQLNGRFYISIPSDKHKDQTYFLWRLSQEQLSRILFPVGDLKKVEVKKIAKENGLLNISQKKESYNICFIPDGDYRSFISSQLKQENEISNIGIIENEEGVEIGKYSGIWNYTIGQQKGLSLDENKLLYITKIDAENKRIIVGDKKSLYKSNAFLNTLNLMKYNVLTDKINIKARINYHGNFEPCQVSINNNQIKVEFINPVLSLAPGQSIAFYEENDLLGGGIISCSTNL
jgi:tRNA-specific 2-thiouridylase